MAAFWKRWFGKVTAEKTPPLPPVALLALPQTCWRSAAALPIPDWPALDTLIPAGADDEALHRFWRSAASSWLVQLGEALGEDYVLEQSEHFVLLAALPPRERRVVLDYAERSRRRILNTLPGVAGDDGHGPTAVLVLKDEDDYYAYIEHYYPDEGVFAMSGGLFINAGYGHFVFCAKELEEMEPVLVHELTHALLRHLQLPRWLDEGAAVNMEKRLIPHLAAPSRALYGAAEMGRKHAAFWDAQSIQLFWTGLSFLRPDDGSLLSYDLAERLTRLLGSGGYPSYAALLQAAQAADGGVAALLEHYGLDSGELIAQVLGAGPWQALPATWDEVEAHAVSQSQLLLQALHKEQAAAQVEEEESH